MASDRVHPAVIYYNDSGSCLLAAVETEKSSSAAEAAASYTSLVHEVLLQLVRLPQFRHIILLQSQQPFQVPNGPTLSLAVAVGNVQLDSQDQVVNVFDVHSAFDIERLLTSGINALPQELQAKVSVALSPVGAGAEGSLAAEEGEEEEEEAVVEQVLDISDEKLRSTVANLNKAIKLGDRYESALSTDAELELVEVLEARLATEAQPSGADNEEQQSAPLQLGEVVELLAAYLVEVAGVSAARPNLLQRGSDALKGLAQLARRLARRLQPPGTSKVRNAVWELEGLAMHCGKLVARVGIKSMRPVLIALIFRRALQTLDASRDLNTRMLKLPDEKQADFYYSQLLGKDWQQQFEQDMVEAIKEVDEGLVTDEINHEKRKIQASLLRRLEIEEWDKERMKHFYYSQYGLGPWYAEMDEKLTNPYFMGARAWNSGVDNWVGDNTIYPNDLPKHQTNSVERAIRTLEQARGVKLSELQKAVLRQSERVQGADQVLSSGMLANGLVDPSHVAAALGR